jgi:hypothetical protein
MSSILKLIRYHGYYSCFVFEKYSVHILALRPIIQSEALRGFFKSHQANAHYSSLHSLSRANKIIVK